MILADHDDTIPAQALYEVAKAINGHPDCDVLYSDEDKLDMDGGALFDPHFKPDFNPDLLNQRQLYLSFICGKTGLCWTGWAASGTSLTGRRTMILSSAAPSRAKEICPHSAGAVPLALSSGIHRQQPGEQDVCF